LSTLALIQEYEKYFWWKSKYQLPEDKRKLTAQVRFLPIQSKDFYCMQSVAEPEPPQPHLNGTAPQYSNFVPFAAPTILRKEARKYNLFCLLFCNTFALLYFSAYNEKKHNFRHKFLGWLHFRTISKYGACFVASFM
jgi:hypothetical protein